MARSSKQQLDVPERGLLGLDGELRWDELVWRSGERVASQSCQYVSAVDGVLGKGGTVLDVGTVMLYRNVIQYIGIVLWICCVMLYIPLIATIATVPPRPPPSISLPCHPHAL